ncbi:MAG: hypothetical protein GF411_12970 [Candidatus Lokiarchaeota archaeon]|nr:hypothetical protein [Candidatus Lokiarchaeota archaeon]
MNKKTSFIVLCIVVMVGIPIINLGLYYDMDTTPRETEVIMWSQSIDCNRTVLELYLSYSLNETIIPDHHQDFRYTISYYQIYAEANILNITLSNNIEVGDYYYDTVNYYIKLGFINITHVVFQTHVDGPRTDIIPINNTEWAVTRSYTCQNNDSKIKISCASIGVYNYTIIQNAFPQLENTTFSSPPFVTTNAYNYVQTYNVESFKTLTTVYCMVSAGVLWIVLYHGIKEDLKHEE